jgi:orotidine-5'-phosphate decarboxylase
LEYKDKWTIVLGLTSNGGAVDFELEPTFKNGGARSEASSGAYLKQLNPLELLYEKVIRKVSKWGTPENLMFVIGATQSHYFSSVRKLVPDHFFLVPGVGAQGGSLTDISTNAMNKDVGLLVNASRAIIYASDKDDFATAAAKAAKEYQDDMMLFLE